MVDEHKVTLCGKKILCSSTLRGRKYFSVLGLRVVDEDKFFFHFCHKTTGNKTQKTERMDIRPAKRTRLIPVSEKAEFQKYTNKPCVWMPPSLLQLCYRTLRVEHRIWELDGNLPNETREKFADLVTYESWGDCHYAITEDWISFLDGTARTCLFPCIPREKQITVFTRRVDGMRACVNCHKSGCVEPSHLVRRIHIDYRGDSGNSRSNNAKESEWALLIESHRYYGEDPRVAITGYAPGKTTTEELQECLNTCHDTYCPNESASWNLLYRDQPFPSIVPFDRGSEPVCVYKFVRGRLLPAQDE